MDKSKVKETELEEVKKKSYSYYDLLKLESGSIYSSIGNMIDSRRVSNPQYSMGTSDRKTRKKMFMGDEFAKLETGQYGPGSAGYFPSTQEVYDKKGKRVEKDKPNPTEKFKYDVQPSVKIGTSPKHPPHRETYDYYKSGNDYLKPGLADSVRRPSQSSVRIGLEKRWTSQRKDRITPGPQYDTNVDQDAPKYTFGFRRPKKGEDPLISSGSTNQIVGPSTYFNQPKKSASTGILRVPATSRISNQPVHAFPKGPKTLLSIRNSVDETYDIKTGAIMAHYDFEYDGGKGLHSGKGWMKGSIKESSEIPIQRNKMKSYTIGNSKRGEQKRGMFANTMSNRPAPVRIQHPKF